MSNTELFYQLAGIIGSLLILVGFYRVSIKKWRATSFVYELDNFIGAVLLIIYQLHFKTYAPVVLNVLWAVVAFRGMEGYSKRRSKAKAVKFKRKR